MPMVGMRKLQELISARIAYLNALLELEPPSDFRQLKKNIRFQELEALSVLEDIYNSRRFKDD